MENISLLDELKTGGYECSLITTFNAYFPFYEDVVLPRLINKGVNYNLLLIDKQQCLSSIKEAPPRYNGQTYSLLPITSKCFHPKLFLLLGKRKGLIAVGSHNMTLSGFSSNMELTNVVRFRKGSDENTLPIFWQVWKTLENWNETLCGDLPQELRATISKCLGFAPWLVESQPDDKYPVHFLSSSPNKKSLWQQCSDFVTEPPQRIAVLGAFFDHKLSFLHSLMNDFKSSRLTVGIQPDTVDAPQQIVATKGFTAVDSSALASYADKSLGSYLHAKAVLLQGNKTSLLISGSANPSAPAWLYDGAEGNIETVLLRRINNDEPEIKLLGIDALYDAPVVAAFSPKPQTADTQSENSFILLTATAHEKAKCFYVILPKSVVQNSVQGKIFNLENQAIGQCSIVKEGNNLGRVDFDSPQFQYAHHIEIVMGDKQLAYALIHFTSVIEGLSVSGWARELQQSLGALGTQTPEVKFIFKCMENVLLGKESAPSQAPKSSGERASNDQPSEEGKSLSISQEELTAQLTAKKHGVDRNETDIEVLMQILARQLQMQGETRDKSTDSRGRNEEEQRDSDDEEIEQDTPEARNSEEIRALFNKRIKSFITRVAKWLNTISEVETSFSQYERLLAVCMFLRLIERHQQHFDWAKDAENLISSELVSPLLTAICDGHLERLLAATSEQKDLENSKLLFGLIYYLAYAAGISLRTKAPFLEDADQASERQWKNAIYLYLASLLQDDRILHHATHLLITEGDASTTIWLEKMKLKGEEIEQLKTDLSSSGTQQEFIRGNVAFYKGPIGFKGCRIIIGISGETVTLFTTNPSNREKSYSSRFLFGGRL